MPADIPEIALQTPDYLVIGVYMLVLIGMGAFLRKRAGADVESYFLAGRKVPGWLNGTSYAATCMNTDVAPAYCGMTVATGVFICWWYISRFGLALMIGSVLFAVFWRRLKLMTSPEFYELRFSGGPALTIRSWVAVRSAFIAVVAWTGSGLLGLHKVAEPLLGWSIWTTFAVVIPIILFYVLLSGYVGVVVSDFFQTLVIVGSSLVLMYMVLADFGGDGGLLAGPHALYQSLLGQFGDEAVSWHPPRTHQLLGLFGVIAWTVGTAIGYGGDAAPMAGAMEGQRILSCKNSREASKMYVWTAVVLFFMLAVLTLPALGAMAKWPQLRLAPDAPGAINREMAYGMMLAYYLPPGLLGLAVSGMLASIMSTVSSNMNFGAQTFVNDVYKRSFVKNASQRHYLLVGRIVAAAIVALAIAVATSATNVIDISFIMLGLSSAELTANWAQWWWWRFNGPARLAASVGGPGIFLLVFFTVFAGVEPLYDRVYSAVFTSIPLTMVLWIVTALVTRPEPEEKLVEFYRRVRPLGFWGPIAEKAGVAPAGTLPIFRGLGIATLGAVTVAAGTIAFSLAYLGRWQTVAAAAAVCLASGVCFKIAYRRHMLAVYQE